MKKGFLCDLIKFTGIMTILGFINSFINVDYGVWAFGVVIWHIAITHEGISIQKRSDKEV